MKKKNTAQQKTERKTAIIFSTVVGVIVLGLFAFCYFRWIGQFSYTKSLDETLFVFADQEVKLRDVTYYILVEEEAVNEHALKYDSEQPLKYWNLKINDAFVSEEAKEIALNYCIRDAIYAYEAKKDGMKLSDEVLEDLKENAAGMYDDLTEKQLDLGLTEEDIYKALCNNRLADEWVLYLAKEQGRTMTEEVLSAYYGMNSYFFKGLIQESNYKLNTKIWDEIKLGRMTIN